LPEYCNADKIISSLGNCAVPTTLPDNYDDHFDDFEAWEPLVEFHEKEDYAGLVRGRPQELTCLGALVIVIFIFEAMGMEFMVDVGGIFI